MRATTDQAPAGAGAARALRATALRGALGRRRLGSLLLAALVLVPAVAGCGAGDVERRNAYVDEVNGAQRRFLASFERLSSQITRSSSPAQDRRTLDRFDEAIDRAVGELRDIEPPGDVRGLHGRLTREIAGYGDAVRHAREALGSQSGEALAAAQAQLSRETSDAGAAIGRTIGKINERLRDG